MNNYFWIFVFSITLYLTSCYTGKKINLPSEQRLVYLKEQFTYNNFTLPYNIIYPKNVKGKLPLIIFLHGSGERGTDNSLQLKHGGEWMKENLKTYAAISVFPQCPTDDKWTNVEILTDANGNRIFNFETNAPATQSMVTLMAFIEEMSKKPYIDNDRIYIMGLSLGGMGTFELLWRMPGKFAAAAPICGGTNLKKIQEIALTNGIWVFHGDSDDVVIPQYSREVVNELKKIGKDVKYSEYKGVGHESWNNVFKEKKFFDWLLSYKKINR